MIQFYLFAILCAVGSVTSEGPEEFRNCNLLTQWKKVGCFKDLVKWERALPDQLVNIRDTNSKVFEPPKLDWRRISDSWESLACLCANATLKKGYKVFGLQFYGECWSGSDGLEAYNRFDNANDEKCVMMAPNWKNCDIASDELCVGKAETNYVYILKEEPKAPVNGEWSEWGDWTECDKTCGTGKRSGKQVRERTCTNPPPDPQGMDCEGPGEESRNCNVKNCPIDGRFTPWMPVPECTKSCGGGTQKLVRTCTNPPPQYGGKDCVGLTEKIERCNEFTCPTPCTRAVDLGVILDATNSVGDVNFYYAKDFVMALANTMKISPEASHLGLIVFNFQARIIVRFNEAAKQNPAAIKDILKKETDLKGRTFTDRALIRANDFMFTPEGGDRADKPNVLIVLTDGKTNSESIKYEELYNRAGFLQDVKVIAVGVGKNILRNELTRIARNHSENVFMVADFKTDLKIKLQAIKDSSCQ